MCFMCFNPNNHRGQVARKEPGMRRGSSKEREIESYVIKRQRGNWESKLGVVWESGVKEGTCGGQLTLKAI